MSQIRRREFLKGVGLGAAGASLLRSRRALGAGSRKGKPNIVFILADDLGYGDLGCYGQKKIQTPSLDRMAAEGTRFTQCYAGSAVCAPTRCALMTGLHTGHCTRRDNQAKAGGPFKGRPLIPLRSEDFTVAAMLKQAGYVTGGIGKWGLGNPGTTGTPERHGFDHFCGYLDQVHAHNYYTDHLWRDGKMAPVKGNRGGKRGQYTHDLFAAATFEFIRRHKGRPFFLYLPYTLPHGKYEVPSDAPYTNKKWPQRDKNYAAMITRLDATVGRILALLKQLGIDEKTIVFFTSDNGPNRPFVSQFNSSGGLRGIKRSLYEGGIRMPTIVRWPGKVPAGAVSDFVWWQVDFMPTAAVLAGIQPPKNLDGTSVLPALLGKRQQPHPLLYWEIHSPFHQAVRMGDWKGVRFGTKEPLELYALSKDRGEQHDVAAKHPDVVSQIEAYLATARTPSKYWPARPRRSRRKKKKRRQ